MYLTEEVSNQLQTIVVLNISINILFYKCLQIKRYNTYVYLLQSKMIQHPEYDSSTALMETDDEVELISAEQQDCSLPVSNRYSYNAAIYSTMATRF